MSPTATALLLFILLLLLLLPTSLSITTKHDLPSPIPKSKPPPKPKSISEPSLQTTTTNKTTKSLKPTKTNSTISSLPPTTPKSKLNKTLPSTPKSLKPINKTHTPIPSPPKSKPHNKTTPKSNSSKPLKSPNHPPPPPKIILTKLDPPTPKPKTRLHDETEISSSSSSDLISEFRDLPSRLHSAILPDLRKLSTTSKLYLSKTHRDIAAGVKPFVGKKYAASFASAASAALLLLPLLLVSALFRHLLRTGSSASLHRSLLFVQAYLAIYFATLSLTALVTGLEPLRFFFAASPAAYAWTQAVQTFGYVVYLIAQLIALVVAFSAGDGEGAAGKAVGMAQMLLGLAVGMHYYITVFHRAVTGDAPRANWKVHGIYAACFVVICGLGRADRRKKAYLREDGGDDGKKS